MGPNDIGIAAIDLFQKAWQCGMAAAITRNASWRVKALCD